MLRAASCGGWFGGATESLRCATEWLGRFSAGRRGIAGPQLLRKCLSVAPGRVSVAPPGGSGAAYPRTARTTFAHAEFRMLIKQRLRIPLVE